MATGKMKYRVLVVGSGDKIFDYISDMLPKSGYEPLMRANDAGEARRLLPDTPADIVIINPPLTDEPPPCRPHRCTGWRRTKRTASPPSPRQRGWCCALIRRGC